MTDFDNTNKGALFKNNDKEDEKHPDYRGNLNVGGTEYWLSAWLKTSKNGMKYMSLAIQPKDARTAKPKNETSKSAGGRVPFDDEIPFAPEFR